MPNNTIEHCINEAKAQMDAAQVYCGHGSDNTWDEAVYLVLTALDLPWHTSKEKLTDVVTDAQYDKITQWLRMRTEERKPLAYITGKAVYAGLEFLVDENTLIPRSPISEFIEYAFEPYKTLPKNPKILDLCTGSGCLALAIAHYFPEARVVGSDISAEALQMAERNKQHLNINNVEFVCSDLFDNIDETFDIIISNPPYVNAEDMASLPPEYLHEPQMALTAGADGLDIVHDIVTQARGYLRKKGLLIVEVGNSAEALVDYYPRLPFVWPEFDNQGFGVFVLNKADLPKVK